MWSGTQSLQWNFHVLVAQLLKSIVLVLLTFVPFLLKKLIKTWTLIAGGLIRGWVLLETINMLLIWESLRLSHKISVCIFLPILFIKSTEIFLMEFTWWIIKWLLKSSKWKQTNKQTWIIIKKNALWNIKMTFSKDIQK